MILNAYGGYDIQYIFNFTHRRLLSLFHIFIGLKRHVRFNSQFTLACRLRFLVDLYGRLEKYCNLQLLLGIVAFRLYLGSSWGMSRRGRRDVEEGIVREGFRGPDLEILGTGSWTLGGQGEQSSMG